MEIETCNNFERLCEPTKANIREQPLGLNYYSFTTELKMGHQERCRSSDKIIFSSDLRGH